VRDRIKDAQQTAQKLIAGKSDQISKADAMKLDYLAEEIEAQLAGTLKNRGLAITGLRLLVGVQPGEDLPIAQEDLPPDAPVAPNEDQMLRKALQQRPETKAAGEGVLARQSLVDLARARLWPDLGLVGGFNYTETTNASNPISPFAYNPYHSFSGYIALGMQGTFDIPQKLARLRQAEADLHEAQATQLGAQQLVRLDVHQALGDLNEARVKVDRYTKESQIGKQLANQAGVAFDSGLGEARDLLEGTILYTRAEGERLGALYAAQLAWAALEKATGGPLQ
jgi:outer membrane protein TolC